jgi:enamine deaminase RidA (YjgF/YER057c/UK114 family)
VGYSRVVRVGNTVHVAGTTATDSEGNIVGVGDAKAQANQAFKNIKWALESVGASLSDVVRTRIFVTDISKWEEVGSVHGEYFKDIRPVTTMVEVNRLIDPDMIIEIEVEAILT